jgi:hypothetical protein
VVDHGKYERAFGATPTPYPEAIQETLKWYRKVVPPSGFLTCTDHSGSAFTAQGRCCRSATRTAQVSLK